MQRRWIRTLGAGLAAGMKLNVRILAPLSRGNGEWLVAHGHGRSAPRSVIPTKAGIQTVPKPAAS